MNQIALLHRAKIFFLNAPYLKRVRNNGALPATTIRGPIVMALNVALKIL
jgi:hypothetical protein